MIFHSSNLPRLRNPRSSPQQSGYALLLVMFLLAIMILLSMPLAQRVITEGRRDREEEMIWRGNQYARGVKLFYMKNHRFPTSMDDLVKPKVGVRFMRQAYKDPMNKEDGSWRLIYVGPSGQLIGSLKPHPMNLQMGAFGGGAPAAPGTVSSNQNGLLSQSGFQSSNSATTPNPSQPGTTAAPGQPATNPASPSQGEQQGGSSAGNGNAPGDSSTPAEGISIMGGNIIGVGSKINKKSIIWYDKARNYRQFEFIWDPAKEAAAFLGQQGNSPNQVTPLGPSPLTGQPGQNSPGGFGNSGFGNPPGGSGPGGFGNPPPLPNPPPNPNPNPPPNPNPEPNPPPPAEQ